LKEKLFEIHEEICKMQLRLKELREDLGLSVKDMARDTGVSQNTIHLYERGGYPSIKQIEMIAKTYDVNPAWLVGWIDDEMMPAIQVVEKVIYKESPTARLPDYHNNNNDGKLIKWKQSRRYRGGRN
jgi:transcriptional regulator with XRE-family HTH domain